LFYPRSPLFKYLIQNPQSDESISSSHGFIRFGSRVDVYLPLDASVKVSIGDKVSATTTILAVLLQKG